MWVATFLRIQPLQLVVALGALEGPTGLQLERHIFVAEKGDYYDIADGLPQSER